MKKTHGGKRKGQGRKALDGATHTKRYLVLLDDESKSRAIEIGGNVSVGIRIAVKAFPLKP